MHMMSGVPFMQGITDGIMLKYVVVAAIVGLGAGMIRERSHSILPAWLFHALAVATSLLIIGQI